VGKLKVVKGDRKLREKRGWNWVKCRLDVSYDGGR